MNTATIDLTDIKAFTEGRHHEMFRWIRAHDPVYWQPTDGGGFWSLTTYNDLLMGYREHGLFSSAHGIVLGGSFHNLVDTSSNQMLVSSDPPRHRQLRHVMRRAFAPRILRRIQHQVESLVDAALDRAIADGGCDFAVDIAPELPTGALMGMAGLSHDDAREVVRLTHSMIGYRRPEGHHSEDEERLRLAGIQADIFDFFADVIAERGRDTDHDSDLLGILLSGRLNGQPLNEEEILYNCLNIAVGGNETSTHSASDGLIALMRRPDQYEQLCAHPDLLDTALNEILRWASPNAYDHRVATRDVRVRDKRINAGDSVALWTISANRDEAQFPDPDTFDITRSPNRHLSFGFGIHRCVGAALGTIELTALYRKLIDAPVRFVPDGAVRRLPSNFIVGVGQLPVRVVGVAR
ncbi:MAG: cytochrome P450 [Nocardioidaceae bacterium]